MDKIEPNWMDGNNEWSGCVVTSTEVGPKLTEWIIINDIAVYCTRDARNRQKRFTQNENKTISIIIVIK